MSGAATSTTKGGTAALVGRGGAGMPGAASGGFAGAGSTADGSLLSLASGAATAAALLAIDPGGLGGVVLCGLPGRARDKWLSLLKHLLPTEAPVRRVPAHVSNGRLLGGLDLTATLRAGKPVREKGLLASADGGMLILAMAERMQGSTAGLIAASLDSGKVRLERDGFTKEDASRFGVIALDEALEEDDRPSAALRERLAFEIDLGALSHRDLHGMEISVEAVFQARQCLHEVVVDDELIEAITGTAMALGIGSLRAPVFAIRAAVAAAALAGRRVVDAEDAALATRLVLAFRATQLPLDVDEDDPADEGPPRDEPPELDAAAEVGSQDLGDQPLEDQLLAAALAALPPGLLDSLKHAAARGGQAGKAGAVKKGGVRGRPAGVQPGKPGDGQRLSIIETLRAAAPWQPLRRQFRAQSAPARIDVRPDDFRVIRQKERSQTTAIFAVDASGSSALERLAEAKGAVELLLAECYTRRDQVALLAFRGKTAELLLPPTRSLVRAKRSLAGLPGGGGTPLAEGVQAAMLLADTARRRGETPLLVFLTDGRANIARDGTPGRKQALADALAMANKAAAACSAALVIDISARPGPEALALAGALGGRYLPLPKGDARALSSMVTSAMSS